MAGGEALLSPQVTRRVIAEFATRPGPAAAGATEALAVAHRAGAGGAGSVGRGLSNAEIAEALFVGAATAKTHVSRVMTKLHARDRAQLVVIAYESGLVTPGGG